MAVYNEPAEWLDGSIGSILTQTFKEFEFIIINDNPDRDELRAILKRYSESDGRIRIIENEQNIGLAKSLNEGLKKAKGKYIARMDSDDISLPERLEMQHRFLEKHTDIFLTGCSAQIMDRNGKLREKAIKEGLHEDIVKAMLAGKLAFYHPTIMFRNEGFLYREKLDGVEDYDLYLGLLHNGKKFGNIQETVFCYRMSGQSVSITKNEGRLFFVKRH